jgi:phosphosulfolactate synthase
MADKKTIFPFMSVPARTAKPRATGMTIVSDGDYRVSIPGAHWTEDLAEWGSRWIDYYKLTHTLMFQPRALVSQKLAGLTNHGIHLCAGGNIMEAALMQDCVEPFFDELQNLGIDALEVSSAVSALTIGQKIALIEKARARGFTVFAKVGKKTIGAAGSQSGMPASEVIHEMTECLKAGAFKAVYESAEISQLQAENSLGSLVEIAAAVGKEKIIFDLPHGDWHSGAAQCKNSCAAFFVLQFGSNVNIGDVEPTQIMALETLRGGLSARTLGRVPLV